MHNSLSIGNIIPHKDFRPLYHISYIVESAFAKLSGEAKPFYLSKKQRAYKKVADLISKRQFEKARVCFYKNYKTLLTDNSVNTEFLNALLDYLEDTGLLVSFFAYLDSKKTPDERDVKSKSDTKLLRKRQYSEEVYAIRKEIAELTTSRQRSLDKHRTPPKLTEIERRVKPIKSGHNDYSSPIGWARTEIIRRKEQREAIEIKNFQYRPVGYEKFYPYPDLNKIIFLDKKTFFKNINLLLKSLKIDSARLRMAKSVLQLNDEEKGRYDQLLDIFSDKLDVLILALEKAMKGKHIKREEYDSYKDQIVKLTEARLRHSQNAEFYL